MVPDNRRPARKHTLEFKQNCIDEYLSGKSSHEVGKQYDVSHSSVQKWVISSGNTLRPHKEAVRSANNDIRGTCIKEYLSGLSSKKVADLYGVNQTTIINWLIEANIPRRDRWEIRGYPKELKDECISKYLNGEHSTKLEEIYGISASTIINWVKSRGGEARSRGEPKVKCFCEYCGSEIFKHKSALKKNHKTFCNKICSSKYQSIHKAGENAPRWMGGVSFEPYCPKFNKDLKERVREFFGRKCVLCGKLETECNRRLCVHHVDYDKTQCCNGKKPYLVPLCDSCHAKTSNDKYREYYSKLFTDMIDNNYGGECYLPKLKD